MINSSGEVVSYEYDDDENLIKVNYGDNQSLTFERGTDYLKVANGDKYAQMTYSNINLTAVEYFTSVNEISNGRTVYFNTPQRIERISFVCGLNASVTTEGQQTVEEYKFDTDGRLTEYCEKEKGKYVKAEKYEYVGMGKYNVSTVQDNGLHSDTVAFEDMCQSTVVFDSFNRVKTESVFNKIIHISNGVKTKRDLETTYKYNEKGQPARAVTNEKIYIDIQAPIKEYNHVVLLEYNERGQLLKKQSYTEGEEKTNGINIEEYDYDKNGYETRSVKYNSLDPSTRLYEQAEVNEKGQITAIYDISGRNRTVYEYLDGTSTACSERYPNGSKLSYGISPIDQSAAITMSTENGEGNSITRLYTNGLATRVIDAENEYDYKYDKKGRVTSITKNNHNYMNFSYIDLDNLKSVTENHRLGLIKKTEKTANYDKLVLTHNSNSGFTAEVRINKHPDGLAMNKIVTKNNVNAYIVEYSYDESKKPSEAVFYRCNDSGVPEPTRVENYTYDSLGNVVSKTVTDGEDETVYSYTFSSDSQSRLESISFDGIEILPKYDCLGRKTEKEVKLNNNSIAKERIDYVKHADHATLMPKSIVYKNGDSVRYNYDRMGYISQIYDNNAIACEYKYDKLGRIIRENNKLFNRTTIYKYDNAGNIIAKGYTSFNLSPSREIEVISTQATYQYSEGGSLSKYGGKLYTTNQITGYPTVWRSEALTWDLCNKLSAFGENTFEYDVEGKRTKKNDISFYYDVSDKLVKQSNGIEYIYDNESIIGFKHTVTTNNISTTNTYFYRKDILGNVIAILDANGNVVVKYVYDAWGNHIVKNASGTVITNEAFIGNINPIRYRSYYYDTETKLYYLNARYYDPDVCRFISPDDLSYLDPETIGGTNLYAYCGNNPVMYADPSGNFGIFSFLIGLGATAFFSWLGGQIFGQQVVSGISSIGSGISTTLTGVSLLAFGPVGWVLGGVVGLIGLGTTLLGVNETVAGITGINYLQQWTGMSDDWYNGLYTGFNIASLVANLVGNAYMKYADVLGKTHIGRTGKPLSRYSLVDENGIKQYRFYDYRGNAWYDKDFRHTGSERKFPHYHGWRDGIRNSKHWSFWELIKWLL